MTNPNIYGMTVKQKLLLPAAILSGVFAIMFTFHQINIGNSMLREPGGDRKNTET